MKKYLSVLLPVLILALAFGLFRVLKATKPEQPPPQIAERVWRVAAEQVTPQTLAPELTLYGQVETPELLRLSASANAFVERVEVRDGQQVEAGTSLVQLDPRDFLPRMAQVQAEIDELHAQIDSENNRQQTDQLALDEEERLLELADQSVARQQRLESRKVGAEQALDDARKERARQALAVSNRRMSLADHPSRLRGLQARLVSAQARLEQLALEFKRASPQAPYDAIIANVEVAAGDQVTRGAELLSLYATTNLEVRARLAAPFQKEILQALNADQPLIATTELAGTEIPLQLNRLDGEAQPSGIDALFTVTAHATLLRVGQVLQLRMERAPQPDAVAVPMAALYGGERLYRLTETAPSNPETDKPITRMRGLDIELLGTRLDAGGQERALVRAPELSAGDRVVVTHLPNAIEGLRVEVIE